MKIATRAAAALLLAFALSAPALAAQADDVTPIDAVSAEPVAEPEPAPAPQEPQEAAVAPEAALVAEPEPEAVLAPEDGAQAAKPGKPVGHDPVTFCHKPGTLASKTLTTDDDGFLQGHLGHGDTLGECPAVVPAFVPYGVSARWLIPDTWDYATTPSYQAAIFPQPLLVGDVPVCRWSQDDDYWLESPAEVALYESLDDDGVLTQGEDSAIYKSHVFTAGPACPEVVTYSPVCAEVTGSQAITGDGVLAVEGDWDSTTVPVPFSGTLADIGAVLDIDASPLQYVGLHMHTALGTIVFEEEGSYAGNLWSNVAWDGVDAGMGYPAFGSIAQFIHLNGDVAVTGVDLLYTHPEASSTTVESFTIGCTVFTFAPVTDEPTEEPTPTPTPTPTEPTPTPTVTQEPTPTPTATQTVVVAKIAAPQGDLAHTGSDGTDRLALAGALLILAGIAGAFAHKARRRA